jgi:hypothetical protein
MATITLKYATLNSSIQVGDHVFFTTLSDSGAYKVNNSISETYGDHYIGDVKSISRTGFAASPFRQIKLTCPAGSSIADGDIMFLAYVDTEGVDKALNIILSSDNNIEDGTLPAVTSSSSRHPAFFETSDTAAEVATKISKVVNNTFLYTSTANVGADGEVIITYKTKPTSYATEQIITENAVGSSNITLTVLNDPLTLATTNEVVVNIANYNADTSVLPFATDYFYFVKDNNVNDSGVLGYYSKVKIENDREDKAELYSVGTELFQSSK